MKIKELDINQRPRERMIRYGENTLSDEELLAILLSTGTKEKSALELSQDIIKEASSIKALFSMSYYELMNIKGIKMAKACNIIAAFELCKRAMSYHDIKYQFKSSKDLYNYLYPLYALEASEALYTIFLDSHLHMIRCVNYAKGEASTVNFPLKRIVHDAIYFSASYVALSHNHPSGDTTPSKSDIESTIRLTDALKVVDIILIDHIILGESKYLSMTDEKII